ncbi:MAG: glycosyltransferase [Bacteroidales bacterium]|nr:glycosyltransferase [Bacteroidales bacterium]
MVSVVMSVYNGELHISKSIESVLAQSYQNFEFIIVDDGSTDSTPQIISHYVSKDKRIISITNQHSCIPVSTNAGIQVAIGDLIAIIDSDDIWLQNKLQHQVDIMNNNPNVMLLGSSVIPIDGDGDVYSKFNVLFNGGRFIDSVTFRKEIMKKCLICHSSSMYRKNAFNALGGYDTSFRTSLDYDLWMRFAASYDCMIDSEQLVFYRIWAGSISGSKKKQQLFNSLRVRFKGLWLLGFSFNNLYYFFYFAINVALRTFLYWLLVKPIKTIFLRMTVDHQ